MGLNDYLDIELAGLWCNRIGLDKDLMEMNLKILWWETMEIIEEDDDLNDECD